MDTETLGHQVTETSRVQVGAASDDAVLGKTAQLPGHVGQDVHCKEGGARMLTGSSFIRVFCLRLPFARVRAHPGWRPR